MFDAALVIPCTPGSTAGSVCILAWLIGCYPSTARTPRCYLNDVAQQVWERAPADYPVFLGRARPGLIRVTRFKRVTPSNGEASDTAAPGYVWLLITSNNSWHLMMLSFWRMVVTCLVPVQPDVRPSQMYTNSPQYSPRIWHTARTTVVSHCESI